MTVANSQGNTRVLELLANSKKEGNELATICSQLKRRSPKDGKMYRTDVADIQGIFCIIQSVPSPKAEAFKRFDLVAIGSFLWTSCHNYENGI